MLLTPFLATLPKTPIFAASVPFSASFALSFILRSFFVPSSAISPTSVSFVFLAMARLPACALPSPFPLHHTKHPKIPLDESVHGSPSLAVFLCGSRVLLLAVSCGGTWVRFAGFCICFRFWPERHASHSQFSIWRPRSRLRRWIDTDKGDAGRPNYKRQGCPKSPEWISSCSASETSLGCEVYDHNNECRAIEVIGQDWSSEVVTLFNEELGAWEGSFELPHDHGPSLPRNEGCELGWLRVAGFSSSTVFAVSGRFSYGRVRGILGAWKVNCHSTQSLSLTVDGL